MEAKKSKSLNYYMRILHRDIGFFTFGLVVIYALSGITLIYRNTELLKQEVTTEKQLKPGMAMDEIGREFRMRDLKVVKTEGEMLYFQNGSYNKATGAAVITTKEIMFPFNKFINFHKAISSKATSWFNVIFAILLLFMAISSFWMFKAGTKTFKRGMILIGAGIVFTVILLLF